MSQKIQIISFWGAVILLSISSPKLGLGQDTAIVSMDQLLEQVKRSRIKDAAANQERERRFLADKKTQEQLIQEALSDLKVLEEKSVALEQEFSANELLISEKRSQRDERLGSLKELFGHLTAVAGDSRTRFRNSITTTQFKQREKFLSNLIARMNDDADLPTIDQIERLWYELHKEATQSAKVVRYTTTVGADANREVVRIGLFNIISNGKYLAYDADTRNLFVLPRQPDGLADMANTLQASTTGFSAVGIDPTGAAGGGFLKAIINTPTLIERWHQGKMVGYIITAIGTLALMISIWRFWVLGKVTKKTKIQLKRSEINTDNPLGRVLKAACDYKKKDLEGLEIKLAEAVIKERVKIQSGLALLKIIAMVAPLLGLLGTVTGMIIVFQAITIYGAGDPKAMAGGISSALVTTVLGLIVAIPTLLLHTLLNTKARNVLQILEEQSTGIVVEKSG